MCLDQPGHHGEVAFARWQQGINSPFHLPDQADRCIALPPAAPLHREVTAPVVLDRDRLLQQRDGVAQAIFPLTIQGCLPKGLIVGLRGGARLDVQPGFDRWQRDLVQLRDAAHELGHGQGAELLAIGFIGKGEAKVNVKPRLAGAELYVEAPSVEVDVALQQLHGLTDHRLQAQARPQRTNDLQALATPQPDAEIRRMTAQGGQFQYVGQRHIGNVEVRGLHHRATQPGLA
ncbi:hypothetical protein D3C80_1378630 [compost metagenome]